MPPYNTDTGASETDIEAMLKMEFERLDSEKKGYIGKEEVKSLMQLLQEDPDVTLNIDELMDQVDPENTNQVTLKALVKFIAN